MASPAAGGRLAAVIAQRCNQARPPSYLSTDRGQLRNTTIVINRATRHRIPLRETVAAPRVAVIFATAVEHSEILRADNGSNNLRILSFKAKVPLGKDIGMKRSELGKQESQGVEVDFAIRRRNSSRRLTPGHVTSLADLYEESKKARGRSM
ncbi:hypothetical protein MRX96_041162 [Rhipicephalus microplus]